MSVINLLNDSVIGKDGNLVDVASFTGEEKIFGLYFSAHWCPPCRGFTPKLKEFYENFKTKNGSKPFEVVFVSSDKSQDDFDGYYAEMPWLALKFSERTKMASLSKIHKVGGIPTFVIVDGQGNPINMNGRSIISDDPEGEKYPWIPPTVAELLNGPLIKEDKTECDSSILDGKIKLLYFSAHWCPPCRAFTPKLVEFYSKMRAKNSDMELVFASTDRDEKSFNEYFATMPWLAFPFGDKRINELNSKFDISGIPTLMVLDKDGSILTSSGRGMVDSDPEGESFPWYPQALEPLTEASVDKINEEKCVIYITDGTAEDVDTAKCALQAIADEHHAKGKDKELFFFYAMDNEITESLKDFLKLKGKGSKLVILVMPQKFICPESNITKETVESFVSDFLGGKLDNVNAESN